jgi:hypothetical protein
MNEQELIQGMGRTFVDAKTALDSLDAALEVEKARGDRIERDYQELFKRVDRFIRFASDFPNAEAVRCVQVFISDPEEGR